MNLVFKILSGVLMAAALFVAVVSISGFLDQEAKSARAGQDAAKANIFDSVGEVRFHEAEREEASANAAAALDAAAVGTAVIILLLAAIVWLLADLKNTPIATQPQALAEGPPQTQAGTSD